MDARHVSNRLLDVLCDLRKILGHGVGLGQGHLDVKRARDRRQKAQGHQFPVQTESADVQKPSPAQAVRQAGKQMDRVPHRLEGQHELVDVDREVAAVQARQDDQLRLVFRDDGNHDFVDREHKMPVRGVGRKTDVDRVAPPRAPSHLFGEAGAGVEYQGILMDIDAKHFRAFVEDIDRAVAGVDRVIENQHPLQIVFFAHGFDHDGDIVDQAKSAAKVDAGVMAHHAQDKGLVHGIFHEHFRAQDIRARKAPRHVDHPLEDGRVQGDGAAPFIQAVDEIDICRGVHVQEQLLVHRLGFEKGQIRLLAERVVLLHQLEGELFIHAVSP
ncbi:hypothetical protein DESC_40045 [Desulfosarcina cetonica]|nr:hypothetical protein DESC_40045 [Desulfosarcina cetonica]